jgi:hypothetical protein
MTAMIPVTHKPRRSEFVIVRLLRSWTASRVAGEPALPNVVACAAELRIAAEAAISLASVFQLAETSLKRSLATSDLRKAPLSCDERAMLALIGDDRNAGPDTTVPSTPDGLPGVLVWAVRTARITLNNAGLVIPIAGSAMLSRGCPFDRLSSWK